MFIGDEDGDYDESILVNTTQRVVPSSEVRTQYIWKSGIFSCVLQLAYPVQPLNTQGIRALEGSDWLHNTSVLLREVQVGVKNTTSQ